MADTQRAGERTIAPGDRVAFRAAFLRSIGDFSHAKASRRGTVANIDDFGSGTVLAWVEWDDIPPSRVHVANLVLASRLHLEPA